MLADMNDLARVLRRIAVTVAGAVIFAVGVVLVVAPGPGLLVIALALVVFAVEYEWARRHLATVQARAKSAAYQAAASKVATASALMFGIGAIGLGGVLIFTNLLPLSGAGTGAGVVVAGLTVLATMIYGLREARRARRADADAPVRPGADGADPAGDAGGPARPEDPAGGPPRPGEPPERREPIRHVPGRSDRAAP